jgi:hypothetical protein
MDLFIWIPITFGLGVITMGISLLFLYACERI